MQNQHNQNLADALQQTDDYRSLFENSPIALWEYDITAVYAHIQNLRESGISDFAAHFQEHPEDINAI